MKTSELFTAMTVIQDYCKSVHCDECVLCDESSDQCIMYDTFPSEWGFPSLSRKGEEIPQLMSDEQLLGISVEDIARLVQLLDGKNTGLHIEVFPIHKQQETERVEWGEQVPTSEDDKNGGD